VNAPSGLAGRGLLQSDEEWDARNRTLADSLHRLAELYLLNADGRGLDVGSQSGELTDYLNAHMAMEWEGIDPILAGSTKSPQGATLHSAPADDIPYPDRHFACILLANVFEHIPPDRRTASFKEMYRVLEPGGIIVGQIPNPYFPIEAHSRLPFMGWLPVQLRDKYWKLAPVPWEHNFYSVTTRNVRAEAKRSGFEVAKVVNFNYPLEALPKAARPIATILSWPMTKFPWAWQFVLRRPAEAV
jgi:SAM-dependent methyltransferase